MILLAVFEADVQRGRFLALGTVSRRSSEHVENIPFPSRWHVCITSRRRRVPRRNVRGKPELYRCVRNVTGGREFLNNVISFECIESIKNKQKFESTISDPTKFLTDLKMLYLLI